ncbi:MAG: exopolysaccharide biosynthesis protein, partial [Dehalococcoidia bacterium]|nr:exopolysaccharide biosynthesis protein [Dehalococcoidia bacterium]
MRKLSLELEELFGANPEGIGLGELMDTLSHRGYGFLFVLLALPAALPVPAAGYASPFALVIIVLGFQVMLGRSSPSLPRRVRGRKIGA